MVRVADAVTAIANTGFVTVGVGASVWVMQLMMVVVVVVVVNSSQV